MINLNELRKSIKVLFKMPNPRMHPLYLLLRDEMLLAGHWRARPRGNPALGYKVMKSKKK